MWGGERTATENVHGLGAAVLMTVPRELLKRTGKGKSFWWLWAAMVALVAFAAMLPWLSGGADIYVHLLWTHQAMRCLAAGELPLWVPDLNGGFGSPGIRLYSPAGPVAAGVLGLLLGSAEAGLRAVLALAVGAVLLLGRRGRGGAASGAMVLLGTPFLADLVVRAAWSQMVAVPLAWWLLEHAVDGERLTRRPVEAGVFTAALWLIHAPTALMVAALVGLAMLMRLGLGALAWGVRWAGTAAALSAWHWLPLLDEMRLTSGRRGLTTGIFDISRNWLGSPTAHAPNLNFALSLAALALATILLVLLGLGRSRENPVRWVLAAVSLGLSTAVVVPLVRLGVPLGWLQFPWRWLTPAALLLAVPAAAARRARWGLLILWLAPVIVLPRVAPISPPPLTAADGWPAVGKAVASFGGNPLAVDALQNRPPWFRELGTELERFGPKARAVTSPPAAVRVTRWKPLRRCVEIESGVPTTVRLRLLRYPGWRVTVDGKAASPLQDGAAVAVAVPQGRHVVEVRWAGNPLSRVGLAVAAAALLLIVGRHRVR